MTNLTEQWKKGELPNGWYWVEGCRAEGIYAYTAEYLNNIYRPQNSDRIIERVLSYEEYQQLLSDQLAKNEGEEINAELKEENTKLKELLKSALSWLPDGSKLRGMRYAQLQSIKRKIIQVLGEE